MYDCLQSLAMAFTRSENLRLTKLALDAPVKPPPVDPYDSSGLPEVPRLVYRLHDVEGLSVKEVAMITAYRPARVRRALERARVLLAAHATR